METFQISAKNLGAMALPDFCKRCFYLKLKVKELPWQKFPGIFSTIDAYTKRVVRKWIDRKCEANAKGIRSVGTPQFLSDYGVNGYVEKVPGWRKFQHETEQGIILTGVPDDIWTSKKGFIFPDYKTAKFTANADKLLPMYRTQLNGYAMIAEKTGFSPVIAIPLIYMVPQTENSDAAQEAWDEYRFKMAFEPKVLPIELDIASIDPLLDQARKLYDGDMPEPAEGCKDCKSLGYIVDLIK